MRLLLVNDSVKGFETFVSASNENTEVILYNTEYDSYDSILAKKTHDSYESVGIVDSNYYLPFYHFTKNEANIFSDGLPDFIRFIKSFNTPVVDFMACELFKEKIWVDIFTAIENEGVDARSSIDKTGNIWAGGNWVMESENIPVNVKDLYFTELIEEYKYLLDRNYLNYFDNKNPNQETDDYIVCNFTSFFALLYKKFKKVWVSQYANINFGNTIRGFWLIDESNVIIDNITNITGNNSGILIQTPTYNYIFNINFNTCALRITDGPNGPFLTDITDVRYTSDVFTFKSNNIYYTTGRTAFATRLRLENGVTGPYLTDVQEVYSNSFAFTARGASGVYAWGSTTAGGINTGFATQVRLQNGTTGPFLTDVQEIYPNQTAFAVKGSSGVYAWGSTTAGGINTGFATQVRLQNGTTGPFLTDVQEIYPNQSAFAVKGSSGVYAWGSTTVGGINTGFATQIRLQNGTTGPFLTDVQEIYNNLFAFAAKGASGVYVWGSTTAGGINTGFATQLRIDDDISGPYLQNIENIIAGPLGFAAKGSSGVYIWGNLDPNTVSVWSTNYVKQVKLYGATGPDLIADEIKAGNYGFLITSTDSTYYISNQFLEPESLSVLGITNSVQGILYPLFYNNQFLAANEMITNTIDNITIGKSTTINSTNIIYNTLALTIKQGGKIFNCGSFSYGGFTTSFPTAATPPFENEYGEPFSLNVDNIYTNKRFVPTLDGSAFAYKNSNGVYAIGGLNFGGINRAFISQVRMENGTTGPYLTDVQEVYSNSAAFSVKGASGVYVWGDPVNGGITNSFATQVRLQNGATGPYLTDVQEVYGTNGAFAAKGVSGVYAWGSVSNGGVGSTGFATQVRLQNGTTGPFLTDVQEIYPNQSAFAVKGATGVYAWGSVGSGGINTGFATQIRVGPGGPFLTDIQSVYNSATAYAVKGASGIYAWGNGTGGGINTGFATQVRLQNGTTGPFLTDVQEIYPILNGGFVTKGASGVYAWGSITNGGINTGFATQVRLQNGTTGPFLTDVQEIKPAFNAVGVKGASGVYAWGNVTGGGLNSTSFATQVRLQNGTTGPFLTDVQELYNNAFAFAVKGASGVYAWGSTTAGGINTGFATQIRISDATIGPFLTDVETIYGFSTYFLAKTPQNYYIWGTSSAGSSTTFAQVITGGEYEQLSKPADIINTNINLLTDTTTVQDLLTQAGSTGQGIAITKATNWRYKPSSKDWAPIENVSDTNALLLTPTTELEFTSGAKTLKVSEPSLDFKAWNGEVGDEEDYLNTNIEYFNLVSDNTATVTVEEKVTPPSDNSTIRILMIVLIVIVAIFVIAFVIWIFFQSKAQSKVSKQSFK